MSGFVGSYFHGSMEQQWQGQVLSSVNSQGNYWFVQTFSWLDGSDSTRHVVSIHALSDWTFYTDPDTMRNNADNARARWVKEEKELQ